jgi:hypothetical protein
LQTPPASLSMKGVEVHLLGAGKSMSSEKALAVSEEWRKWLLKVGATPDIRRVF